MYGKGRCRARGAIDITMVAHQSPSRIPPRLHVDRRPCALSFWQSTCSILIVYGPWTSRRKEVASPCMATGGVEQEGPSTSL